MLICDVQPTQDCDVDFMLQRSLPYLHNLLEGVELPFT